MSIIIESMMMKMMMLTMMTMMMMLIMMMLLMMTMPQDAPTAAALQLSDDEDGGERGSQDEESEDEDYNGEDSSSEGGGKGAGSDASGNESSDESDREAEPASSPPKKKKKIKLGEAPVAKPKPAATPAVAPRSGQSLLPKVKKEKSEKKADTSSAVAPAASPVKGGKGELKDKNAPKQARNAYNYFVEEVNVFYLCILHCSRACALCLLFVLQQARSGLKESHPGAGFGELMKLSAEMWKGLSDADKEKFNVMAKADKQR